MVCKDVFMFVDETGNDDKSSILAVACITTNNPDFLRREIDKLKQTILQDPYLKTIPTFHTFCEKGFHFCDDHDEVRRKFIELIMQLPFKAYICYQHKKNDYNPSEGYAWWYDKMFRRIMFERLRVNHDASIQICFEQQGNQIGSRLKEIETIIDQLVQEIKLCDRVEFPISPKITSAGKNELCLAIADYVAAIFKDYIAKGINNSTTYQWRNFNKLRPKARWIHEYGTRNFFTCKNPFP